MDLIKLIRAVLGAILVVGSTAVGQPTRIAYVATEAILDRLPDARSARAKLAEIQSSWLREIERQEGAIATVRQEIQTNRLLWNQQEKQEATARLADLESKLAAYRSARFGPKGEYEKLQVELIAPIVDKVNKAIEEEARAGKYDYVFDKSSRAMGIVYANPANDITVGVLRRLGVDVSQEFSGTTAPPPVDQGTESDAMRNRGRRDRSSLPEQPPDPNDVLQPDKSPPPPPEGVTTEPRQ